MVSSTDMLTPVTRGELRAELQEFEIRLEQKLEQKLEQRLVHLATKAELESWGGALLARIESVEQRMLAQEQRLLARIESGEQRMIERMDSLEQRLLAELGRHTRAISESMSTQIAVIDEKYADLPPRVSRLETEVLPPGRR